MSHINSIGAGLYSDLSVCTDSTVVGGVVADILAGTLTKEDCFAGFAAADFTAGTALRIVNVREFPAVGTPPNVVNVPVYGAKTSQQIQGQADAPSIEITLNYVASDWASGSDLGDLVGDGNQYLFRFTLLNSKPTAYSSEATGLGTVKNSQWFWIGKIEALQVTPQLTDANTATLTITVQSDFFGAYTNDAAN